MLSDSSIISFLCFKCLNDRRWNNERAISEVSICCIEISRETRISDIWYPETPLVTIGVINNVTLKYKQNKWKMSHELKSERTQASLVPWLLTQRKNIVWSYKWKKCADSTWIYRLLSRCNRRSSIRILS